MKPRRGGLGQVLVFVRLDNPLKQGLKPLSCTGGAGRSSPPGQSIKTRVEALHVDEDLPRRVVRLDNPLKQGLKLAQVGAPKRLAAVRLDNPLKQGLKLAMGGKAGRANVVRLDNPLKQGLKLSATVCGGVWPSVRLDNPLKQGLKLHRRADPDNRHSGPPGQSIKTRVEARPCG